MYKFLENYDSTALWLFASRKFLNEATNCIPSKSQHLILSRHTKRVTPYLRKIRTKIKGDPFFDDFRRQVKTLFQQVNTKNTIIGNHFKFIILILFLRLYTILKSCKQSFRLKSPRNQNSIDPHLFPSSCHYLSNHTDVIHYAKQIIDNYLNSFAHIFKLECKNMPPHTEEHKRVRRNLRHDNGVNYTVKSRIPVTIEERTPSRYVDNSYQEALIANFLANSLPDLKFPPVMVEDAYEKAIPTSTKSYEIVNVNSFPLPQPAATLQSTVVTASPVPPVRWNIQSTTQLYPVPFIPSKPKPYKPPPTLTIEEPVSLGSHHHISTPSGTSQIISNLNWYQPVGQYPSNWNQQVHPQYPSTDDDIYLHFPYPTVSSQTHFTPPPGKLPNYEEPIFVEPIVVSSVDQLPINYPIPMENASLSHNPITVITGSRPPEIVILEDTFQTDIAADEEPAGTTATGEATAPVAADPPAAAGSSSAIGPAAAAAAGLGAVGAAAAAAGVAGAAGGAAAGAGAAGLAAAAGGAGGGEISGDADIGAGVDLSSSDLQVRPTDAIAYAPAGDEETALDVVFGDLSEFFVWFLSFGFVRSILSAFSTLVFPHISFLLTSGLTVLAFFFPWLYPHVVAPLTSLLSSLAARDMDNG